MDKFDDFLDSVKVSAMLNDFIAFLGFNDYKINYIDCCLAEVAVGDITISLSVNTMYNEGYFTVYDTDYHIKDSAYFRFDGGKWIEAY
jgi:hypothetical protein